MMRIQPYRTLDNIIEGAVITFVDISQIIQMKKMLSDTNQELFRMAVIIRDANDAVTMQDLDGKILAWNKMAAKMYGWSEAEALKMNIKERIPKEQADEELETILKLGKHEIMEPYSTKRKAKSGSIINILLTSTALVNEAGKMYGVATTEREIK